MKEISMPNEREDARTMFFEEGTLFGVAMIATGTPLKRASIPPGCYCYDVYTDEKYQDAEHTVVLRDLSECANGSVILAEPLDFEGKEEMKLEQMHLYEESPLTTLEKFVKENIEQEQNLEFGLQSM